MNALLPPRSTAIRRSRRPFVAAALDPFNLAVVVCGILLVLLLRYASLAPLIALADALAIGAYLAIPSRRALVVGEARRRRRRTQSESLRPVDRAHHQELEDAIRCAETLLTARARADAERLLDMFVEVGLQASYYEARVERFGRLPAETPPIAMLVDARRRRRVAAARALEGLIAQLATISSLIQLGCEDAIATRAEAISIASGAEVDDASAVAQLAAATTDAFLDDGDEVTPATSPSPVTT